VHIAHIGSTGREQIPVLLRMIKGANSNGLDISTEVYPYGAANTAIGTPIFDAGWRERLSADFSDIEWVKTGERLTADTFSFYRREHPSGMVIAHVIPENMVRLAVADPNIIIISDAGFSEGKRHPRGAGSFSRVLGRYVREEKLLPLMTALRKMTLMPAMRLQNYVPQMRNKGRIKIGADADITIFNADTIIDRATFSNSSLPSYGITHVLVGGTFVVKNTVLLENVYPGEPIIRTND
jgi:dihydroorotase